MKLNLFNRNKDKRARRTAKQLIFSKLSDEVSDLNEYKTELIKDIGNLEKKRADVAEKTLFNALDLQEELDKVGLGDAVPLKRSIKNEVPVTDIASALQQIAEGNEFDMPNWLKPLIKGFLSNPNNRQMINEKMPDLIAKFTNQNTKVIEN